MPIKNYKDKNDDEDMLSLYSNIYINTTKSNTRCNSRDGTNQFFLFKLTFHFIYSLMIFILKIIKIVKNINLARMRLCKEG